MTKPSTSFMSAQSYGRSLAGLGLNLLVRDIPRAVDFAQDVLGATILYAEREFAVICYSQGRQKAEWMLHKDDAYKGHPILSLLQGTEIRGAGMEIRLYDCDPDRAVQRAKEKGYHVLAEAKDKPHGQREAYILDHDGYCWVPGIPL